jgi:hypothetical protein
VKDLALALHMPNAKISAGEPAPAYFVIKNLGDNSQGLDMRLDFVVGRPHLTVNACAVHLKALTPTKPSVALREHRWECGSELPSFVPARGYYVSALDLAAYQDLQPGDYEIYWTYASPQQSRHKSNVVRFSVLPGQRQPRPDNRRHWAFWQLREHAREIKDKEVRTQMSMSRWRLEELSVALSQGCGDRYVTDLNKLPDRDAFLEVSAVWKLGQGTDRVELRFSGRDPKVPVQLGRLHWCLLVECPGHESGLHPSKLQERSSVTKIQRSTSSLPTVVELVMPSAWRKDLQKGQGSARASFLISSEPLIRNHRIREETAVIRLASKDNAPLWNGILKTRPEKLSEHP